MEDRGTSSGWPTSRPPGTDHKHQICFGTTVHWQTDLTRWRLTSGADSRRAETRTRVLKTYEKIPLTSRREGESLVLVLLRLTISEPLEKRILKVLSRFFSSSASATPWKVPKQSQLFFLNARNRLRSVFVLLSSCLPAAGSRPDSRICPSLEFFAEWNR